MAKIFKNSLSRNIFLTLIFIINSVSASRLSNLNNLNRRLENIENRKDEENDLKKVNINRKLKEIKQLTKNAALYLAKKPLDIALNDFVYNPIWRKGEIFVFVLDQDGTFYASGDDSYLIWKNLGLKRESGSVGTPIIKEMLNAGKKGGRISYLWKNGYQLVYVKNVEKNGKTFIVGSGFYPENDQFVTKQLVKTAVNYFDTEGSEITFSMINSAAGSFVHGDIYIFAYDFDGVCLAHSQNAALVGQNLINLKDSQGKFFVQALIETAKDKKKGWVSYYWHNEYKDSYVERVVDPQTKKTYLIGAGYYPHIHLETVKEYVRSAVKHMQDVGIHDAFGDFTSLSGKFNKGGLGIFVYGFNGLALANGINPAFVGQDLINRVDQNGKPIVKDMIDIALRHDEGTLRFRENNAYTIAYIERAVLPQGKFIVGAEFHPTSKANSTRALVEQAIEYLNKNNTTEALFEFGKIDGQFIRGDLNIFVYSPDGTRYVNGIHKQDIWRNYLRRRNQEESKVVKDIIDLAIKGGGWFEYKVRNATRRVYVKAVAKKLANNQTELFILGSGYFL